MLLNIGKIQANLIVVVFKIYNKVNPKTGSIKQKESTKKGE